MRLVERIELACLLEATARKPGNVHPGASFPDLAYADFVAAGAAIAPVLSQAEPGRIGDSILKAVGATRERVATNANLGIVLLLAPLCAAYDDGAIDPPRVEEVLAGLTIDDASQVYAAIRLAMPGGLGQASEQDVAEAPTVTLRAAMELAADRDLVARQYAGGYAEAFRLANDLEEQLRQRFTRADSLPALTAHELVETWEEAIVGAFVRFLAETPDTLIARKRGQAVAEEASRRARLACSGENEPAESQQITEFDDWLRADGHARNPGATADLMAAALFIVLSGKYVQTQEIPVPTRDELLNWASTVGAGGRTDVICDP
jgi:triphosphoribosyl-dephospho-CoA synthase